MKNKVKILTLTGEDLYNRAESVIAGYLDSGWKLASSHIGQRYVYHYELVLIFTKEVLQ